MTASYALLGILGRQPSYGYDLKRDYDQYYGKEKPLAFGQVYATLARLLRDKKVEMTILSESEGPERKQYAITEHGRKDLEAWLIAPEQLHPNAQTVLFSKVVTAILLDKEPDIYLDAQRAAHLARMRELTMQRRNGDLAQSLQADYALFHLEADLRWIDITAARLQTLAKEIRGE
ncbi:MAG TPA: PadR family transcriptional regulator [Candidatus Saccharimonadia bacterium]|nr:PadR family transcriptional regulator [Candidatus Saccharimonadia bacterium]